MACVVGLITPMLGPYNVALTDIGLANNCPQVFNKIRI